MYIISELTYTVKLNEYEFTNYPSELRIWLFIEATFFFIWIISGIIFVLIAHLLKFRSSIKDDFCLEEDPDVWNNRRIDDFLRYIKFDFFVSTLNISFLLMELMMATSIGGKYPSKDERISSSKVKMVIALLIVQKSLWIIHNSIVNMGGKQENKVEPKREAETGKD